MSGVNWNPRALEAINRAIHNGIDAAAEVIVNEAVAIHGRDHGGVPSKPFNPPNVQTNNLRGSIRRTRAAEFRAGVGTAVDYGKYLEFGTERMLNAVPGGPRPWLRPALARATAQAKLAFAAGVRVQLKREGLSK